MQIQQLYERVTANIIKEMETGAVPSVNPNNHGGYLPAGGMTIDGFFIPSGVWVAQFDNFGNQTMVLNGNNNGGSAAFPGIVFRGDSWRGTDAAPGFLVLYANSNMNIWSFYSDAGGLGAATNQDNEIPFSLNDGTSNSVFFRNYISYTTTGIQANTASSSIVENYIEKIALFGAGYHLNGMTFNGGSTLNALVFPTSSTTEKSGCFDEPGMSG
jgi:hypothetical protein